MAKQPFPTSEEHRRGPDEGQTPLQGRAETERRLRRMARAARSDEPEGPEAREAAMRDAALMDEGETSLADQDRAQERVLQAWETNDPNTMKGLIEEALELDPRNADALDWMARNLTVTPEEDLAGVRRAVEPGAAAPGKPHFREHQGEFDERERAETESYIQDRAFLAQLLRLQTQPQLKEAPEHLKTPLEQNLRDKEGVGNIAVTVCLERGDVKRAREILERFPEDDGAHAQWARVLVHWLEGEMEAAASALSRAYARNPHVEQLLIHPELIDPNPRNSFVPGTVGEAEWTISEFDTAWDARPQVIDWLRERREERRLEERRAWTEQVREDSGAERPPWLDHLFDGRPEPSHALGKATQSDPRGALPWLYAALHSDVLGLPGAAGEGYVPIQAALLLGQLRVSESVPLLVDRLVAQESGVVEDDAFAAAIAMALIELGPESAEPVLAMIAGIPKADRQPVSHLDRVLAGCGAQSEHIFRILQACCRSEPMWGACLLTVYGDERAIETMRDVLGGLDVRKAYCTCCNQEVIELCQDIEELGGRLTPEERAKQAKALQERRRVTPEIEEEEETPHKEITPEPVPALCRTERPGRNDPCWCGSGKKYKRCHMLSDEEQEANTRGG